MTVAAGRNEGGVIAPRREMLRLPKTISCRVFAHQVIFAHLFIIASVAFALPASFQQTLGGSALNKAKSVDRVGCGPATLSICLRLLNKPIDNVELAALSGPTGDCDLQIMASYLESKGLHTVGARMTPTQLVKLHNLAILQVHAPVVNEGGEEPLHFTVFAGAADDKSVFLYDPVADFGPRGLSPLELLEEKWTGYALIVSRGEPDMEFLGQPDRPVHSQSSLICFSCCTGAAISLGCFLWRKRGR